jgi:hypothetical protein
VSDPIWQRQRRETEVAYQTFLAYRDMPKPRSTRALALRIGKAVSVIQEWSSRHKWTDRCLAWDNHQQAAADAEAVKFAAKWEARRQAAIERRFERARQLDERAQAMLALPITRKVKEERDDKGNVKLVVFEPAGWRQRDAALMVQLADALEREAIEAALPPKKEEDRGPGRISAAKAEAMLEAASSLEDDYDPPSD